MEKTLKIFLVEDSDVVAENLIDCFNELLLVQVVARVKTEADAIDWMSKNSVDVSIIDVMLAKGNGMGVLKGARQFKTGKWIVLSNHSQQALRDMAIESGADLVYDKSNELDSLLGTLRTLQKG